MTDYSVANHMTHWWSLQNISLSRVIICVLYFSNIVLVTKEYKSDRY